MNVRGSYSQYVASEEQAARSPQTAVKTIISKTSGTVQSSTKWQQLMRWVRWSSRNKMARRRASISGPCCSIQSNATAPAPPPPSKGSASKRITVTSSSSSSPSSFSASLSAGGVAAAAGVVVVAAACSSADNVVAVGSSSASGFLVLVVVVVVATVGGASLAAETATAVSTYQMVQQSTKMVYDGPIEAMLGVFDLMMINGRKMLTVGVLGVLVIGGILGGMATEWAGRKWR